MVAGEVCGGGGGVELTRRWRVTPGLEHIELVIEESDDVQDVYFNFDIPDAVLQDA